MTPEPPSAGSPREIREFVGHKGHVCCLAISPDGRFLLTGSDDKSARLWEIATGAEIRRYPMTMRWFRYRAFSVVAFSPDGARLLTAEAGGPIRI